MKRIKLPGIVAIICILTVAIVWHLSARRSSEMNMSVADIPQFSGEPYVVINENKPEFTQDLIVTTAYERYAELDVYNRCGYAIACVGVELMPTEERGAIGQVKPTGWQTVKYDFVDGKYLYNRCHLIGFQLTGENANERNLITGTRYLNVEGMLPFENMVADYIKETENHVMYRVTPIFRGQDLVASGVQMEALSVEDSGAGICFNVYVYNAQPGVVIDYATGESRLADTTVATTDVDSQHVEDYILNTNSKKFHLASCTQGQNTKKENRQDFTGIREELTQKGYLPAGCCDP